MNIRDIKTTTSNKVNLKIPSNSNNNSFSNDLNADTDYAKFLKKKTDLLLVVKAENQQELIHKLFTNLAKLMQTLSSAPDPAVSIAVTILALLLALTGFGLWTAFGPKAAKLTDPWDDHDD